MSFRYLLIACIVALPLSLTACGDGSSTTTPGGGESGGGGAIIPPAPGEEPAPEFKDTRTAIQPVNETVVSVGADMAVLVAKAETSILQGDGAAADGHILAMLDLMASEAADAVADSTKAGVIAALASDLKTVKDRAGAPTIKVVEIADKCCGGSGRCDADLVGGICYEVMMGEAVKACGGGCGEDQGDQRGDDDSADGDEAAPAEEPEPEAAPATDEVAPAEETEAAPATEEAAPAAPEKVE
jgi:hypothetical protein